MQQLLRHSALIIAIIIVVLAIIVYFTTGEKEMEIPMIIGLLVIGILFFLLWLGQRGED